MKVFVDNMGAKFMTENLTSSNRTRHMDTWYHFVNDFQESGLLVVVFCPTHLNRSDPMTKNVTGEVFNAHLPYYSWDKGSFS